MGRLIACPVIIYYLLYIMKLEDLDKIPTLSQKIKTETKVIAGDIDNKPIKPIKASAETTIGKPKSDTNNIQDRINKYVEIANSIKDSIDESKIKKESATFLIRSLESLEKTLRTMTEKTEGETNQVNNFLIILKDKIKDNKNKTITLETSDINL